MAEADVAWFADAWERGSIDYYLTLARGISPRELAERLAGGPVEQLPDMTPDDAYVRVDLKSVYTVGRMAVVGGWSLLVETGASYGMHTPPEASRDGVELLVLDPRQDAPPSSFAYLKDGELLLYQPTSSAYDRGGRQPDVLLSESLAAGLVTAGGPTHEEMYAPADGLDRRTIHMLGDRFGLHLPKEIVDEAALPAVVVRTSPPSTW
ncbi:DUF6461 domain-containing protein [Streptomyces aculeolatus]